MQYDRVGLLGRLAGSKWYSDAKALRTATLALIHYASEYCASIWCNSKHIPRWQAHIRYPAISDWMPSPYSNRQSFCPGRYYFILNELRRKRATSTLSIARHTMDPEHLLYDRLLFTPTTQQRELISRHPFVLAALELLKDLD